MDIEVFIPAKDFKWLPADMGAETPVAADVIFNNSDQEHVWTGRVARVKARMDEKTRTLPVVIEVDGIDTSAPPNAVFRLRPGMFVTVKIKGKAQSNAFLLPRHVVYPGNIVYTVEDNQLKLNEVTILRSYKDSVIVEAGLSDGDLVVKTPLSGAVDGMKVRVRE